MTAEDTDDARARRAAEGVAATALARGWSVATAESLTCGGVACALGAAPRASEWFRGSVIAYSSEVKFDLLQVPRGPVVSGTAAVAMARGAAQILGADLVLAVTGAGGPEPQDGRPPGTVWFAVVGPDGPLVVERRFPGRPDEVVRVAVATGLELLARAGATATHGTGDEG